MAGKSKAKRTRRKALARKVTRKRGVSYDRMSPNKRGVTAISEINGSGAYEKRYRRTRRLLTNEENAMARAKTWEGTLYRKQRKLGRSAAQARATVRMVKGLKAKGGAPKRKANGAKRKASGTKRGAPKRSSGTKGAMRPNLRRAGKRVTKTEFVSGQLSGGRSKKQAEAAWKLASGYYTKKRKAARKKPRTYGKGKYRALTARAGSKKRGTYFYRTKSGNVRKIPDHALMGYASARKMAQVYRTGTDRQRSTLSKKLQAMYVRREKAADRAASSARKGTAWFSPNPGNSEILELEEWQQMLRNKKKRKTTKAKRNPRGAGARDTKGRFKKKRKTTKRKTTKRKTAKRKTTRRKTTRRKSTRKKVGFAAMTKAARCKAAAKGGRTTARKTRKKGKKRAPCKRYKRNAKGSYLAKTRKKSTAKRNTHKRKSYKRNAQGAAYKDEMKKAFKYGLIVTGGFVGHRVVTNLLDTYVLTKVAYLNEGTMAPYRKLIAGAAVAAIGVPLVVRALPKNAGVAAAGVAASFLYGLIVEAAAKMDSPKVAEAIAAYTNAPGYAQYSGAGAYYEFSPHQVFDGYGEFYETQPIPGLEQAAANGYGNVEGQMLTQAAAGYGNLTQMYANQGVGEYFAYGAEGIGEYESAPAVGGPGGYTYDGIQPNLHSAEQMLDVAEAAAGLGNDMLTQAAAGFGDVPLQSTVSPMIRAMDIPDEPGGSRAGILAGGDGIFG